MAGFILFIVVLVVIWTLSGIATFMNKQKEAERRRLLREQLGQPPGTTRQTPRGPRRAPAKTISRGIADRFPDVLLPPTPQQPMRKPMPPRQPAQPMRKPVPPRPVAKRPKPRVVPQQSVAAMILEEERPTIAAPATGQPSPSKQPTTPRITANTISRWLRPQTLNQQFVLTEIFQPPVAFRDRHLM